MWPDIINHCKDPYWTTSIVKVRGFLFRVSHEANGSDGFSTCLFWCLNTFFVGHNGVLIGYHHHPVLERVLYEDCSKTLRKETFFQPPGAHHQTNSMEFHPPTAPNILWVEILRKGGGPKHVPRFSPSTVDQFSVESGPCQLTTVIPSEWPLKGIVFWSICRWFRQKCLFTVPSQSLTWNLKMMVSTWNLLFHGLIFRFHV